MWEGATPWFHTLLSISSSSLHSSGSSSCYTSPGPRQACALRSHLPSPSSSNPSATAPMSPNRSRVSPTNLIVPCVNETRHLLNHRLQYHPTVCPRRTDTPVRSTPAGTFVPMPVVPTEA